MALPAGMWIILPMVRDLKPSILLGVSTKPYWEPQFLTGRMVSRPRTHQAPDLQGYKYFQTNTNPTNKKRWKPKQNRNHQLAHGPGILQWTLWGSWTTSRKSHQADRDGRWGSPTRYSVLGTPLSALHPPKIPFFTLRAFKREVFASSFCKWVNGN